ncbi:hypothetical protein GTR02_11450 [Kineococcus sp. R8]|uniref:hypothetical protein n=1 Tax=Kineococcus siccus TaxID=2696567 RepID=UPI0014135CEF|nr:hypothetical protein [Kineococcus siccus]NAZ82435.1 hypothetical protein [Kineococcus siccus]
MSTDETRNDHEVDVFDNAEVRQTSEQATSPVARASGGGGPLPSPARPEGAVPGVPDDDETGGTAAGDPTAGVQISAEDAAAAVPGDEGPENPGTR